MVGGFVYDGPIAEFQGSYIFADSQSHNIWTFDWTDPNATPVRINDMLVSDDPQNVIGDGLANFDIIGFAEDGSGNLYAIQLDGDVHKFAKNLPGSHTVIVEGGQIIEDLDFGNQDPQDGSIGDFVWQDDNANGIQDDGELGIEGVVVNLLDANGGEVQSVTTMSDGSYSFGGLSAGQYSVEFVAPDGFFFSPPNQGDDALDSDADRTNGRTLPILLNSSTNITTIDAGLYELASVGDRVWDDVNGNGVQDDGEQGLAGVQVDLLGPADDFQEGTTENWIQHPVDPNFQPLHIPNGGPNGVGDGFMRLNSTGIGREASRLVARNESQWTGDFTGLEAIEADVTNLGSSLLTLRIAIQGPNSDWWASSTDADHEIPVGADWDTIRFSLDPDDFVLIAGGPNDNINDALANVVETRLVNSVLPEFRGDTIAAALGVDNIRALVDSTLTSGNGIYGLTSAPGTYQVRFTPPEDRLLSPKDAGDDDGG